MKNDSDQIPLPTEQAKEQAWQAARLAFTYSQKFKEQPVTISTPFWKRIKWLTIGGLTTAVIVFVILLNVSNTNTSLPSASPLASVDDIKILKNIKTLFPKNLKSLESTDGGEYQMVLSQGEDTESVLPLVIEVQAGTKKKKVITFSGQTFMVPKPDGTSEQVEVYFNSNGEILLIGPTIMWRSNQENSDSNFKIKAEALPPNTI